MQEGNAPYVFKNGKYQRLELHHSQQDGRGPLFELTYETHQTHTNKNGRIAVHPHRPGAHPHFPVPENRNIFGNDQTAYWKDRAKQFTGEK